MENVKGLFTGEEDVKGSKIYYETSKLKLPNGTIAKLMFDYGQLAAYYASYEDNTIIVELEGVNNHKSFYLCDCELL